MPDPDSAADMYEATVRIAADYGYHHYEVSSYAKRQQAISRHNFSYWQGMDFLGIGPGAHGRLTDIHENQRVRTFGVVFFSSAVKEKDRYSPLFLGISPW